MLSVLSFGPSVSRIQCWNGNCNPFRAAANRIRAKRPRSASTTDVSEMLATFSFRQSQ